MVRFVFLYLTRFPRLPSLTCSAKLTLKHYLFSHTHICSYSYTLSVSLSHTLGFVLWCESDTAVSQGQVTHECGGGIKKTVFVPEALKKRETLEKLFSISRLNEPSSSTSMTNSEQAEHIGSYKRQKQPQDKTEAAGETRPTF